MTARVSDIWSHWTGSMACRLRHCIGGSLQLHLCIITFEQILQGAGAAFAHLVERGVDHFAARHC